MIDYLIHVPDGLAAHAEAAAQWARLEAGQWVFALPTFCGALSTVAYSDLDSPARTDEAGNVLEPGTGAVPAPGDWVIVSIGNGSPIPDVVAPFVVAQGARESGLPLPVGVVGLAPIWAGMKLTS